MLLLVWLAVIYHLFLMVMISIHLLHIYRQRGWEVFLFCFFVSVCLIFSFTCNVIETGLGRGHHIAFIWPHHRRWTDMMMIWRRWFRWCCWRRVYLKAFSHTEFIYLCVVFCFVFFVFAYRFDFVRIH